MDKFITKTKKKKEPEEGNEPQASTSTVQAKYQKKRKTGINKDWLQQYPWLDIYYNNDGSEGGMMCKWCMAFNTKNIISNYIS